jgi:hypothetical protein
MRLMLLATEFENGLNARKKQRYRAEAFSFVFGGEFGGNLVNYRKT